jgi:glycosyltransferase involved in cell wall biosynthesis
MKRLLILASIFPPQKKGGGPAVSLFNLVRSIKDNYDIYIISHNHEIGNQKPLDGIKNGWNKFDYGNVYYFGYGKDKYIRIGRIIKEIQPDIVYLNSFFSFHYIISALLFHKKNKHVRTIIAPRGELCRNALNMKAIKKYFFLLLLRLFNLLSDINWHATSEIESFDLKNILSIPPGKIYNIMNFPGIKVESYYPSTKIRDRLKMIYLSRIQRKKNLLQGLNYLRCQKGNIFLDIYGPIEEEEYWKRCKVIIVMPPGED